MTRGSERRGTKVRARKQACLSRAQRRRTHKSLTGRLTVAVAVDKKTRGSKKQRAPVARRKPRHGGDYCAPCAARGACSVLRFLARAHLPASKHNPAICATGRFIEATDRTCGVIVSIFFLRAWCASDNAVVLARVGKRKKGDFSWQCGLLNTRTTGVYI